jgi:hypothetical protein
MTTTTEHTGTPAPLRSAAAAWGPVGRVAAATTFALGGALWTVGDLIGFGKDGGDHLAYMHDHPGAAAIGLTGDLLGTLFMLGAAAAWFQLSRHRSPKLAVAGAVLLSIGLAMQCVVSGVEMTQFALVRSGVVSVGGLATALASPTALGLPGYVAFPLWIIGAFVGIVVAMVALWRSHAVARPAIVLVLLFQVTQFVGVVPGSPFLLVGLVWMAVDVLRSAPARDLDAARVMR